MGLNIDLNDLDIERLNKRLLTAQHLKSKLLGSLAFLVERQTRKRIADDKKAPDGNAWKKGKNSHSFLYKTGKFHASIYSDVQSNQVVVGSSLKYIPEVMQFGATILPKRKQVLSFVSGGKRIFAKKVSIPARPWLGLSHDNEEEITQLAVHLLSGVFDE